MAEDPCPNLVVCVLGLSHEKGENFSEKSGIGKSCLCYRFMHPGHDDYIDKHSSLLALHEFENPVINSVHFLYWGSTTKRYSIHGGLKEQRIQFHVIEQTVFYQDVTSHPFKTLTKPDSLEHYIRRATTHIESPGKISYKSRDTISLRHEYVWQTYPSGISGLPRGFIVVIDVSQNGADFDRQIVRAERIMEYLLKHRRKVVIVATKRDVFNRASMNRVQQLKKKYKTQVFEASASVNLNISNAFRFIAFKVLHKEIRGVLEHIPTYEEAAHQLLHQKASSRRIFQNFLKTRVVNSDERVNELENMEEYKDCIHVVGKFETDLLFADHLIEVHSKKIMSFAVVQENPQLILEFLEDFVDQREDLTLYSQRLKRWIRSSFQEHPVRILGAERSNVASVSPTTKEINKRQGCQVLHDSSNSFSGDSKVSTSYVNYPFPLTEKSGTIATSEGGQVVSEMQEPNGKLQDNTSPTLCSKLPHAGPGSTVLSADETKVQASDVGDVGDMDKEEGGGNMEVFTNKLSEHLGEVFSLTKEVPPKNVSTMWNSDNVEKHEKPRMPFGSSDIKRRAKHLKKLLSGEEATVKSAPLSKSSPPAPFLTNEAPVPSLRKHSHVDTSFKPSFVQLVKQDSDDAGQKEKPVTPLGSSDIRRRAEHLKKLLSGDKEDLEPTVTDVFLNTSSPPVIPLTEEAPVPSLKEPSHFDLSFKPSFAQLVKQDCDDVGNEEKPITTPGNSDTNRCTEHPKKLLSGRKEELEQSVAEVLLNKHSLPQKIDGNQKQSLKTFRPGTRKPVRPAPKPPASPKSAKNDSLKERPVKPASPSRLREEQVNKPQFSQLFQLPPSPLQPSPLQPSPLQPSPVAGPPATNQTPKQNPVTPVNGSIPEKETYVPRLPEIKKRIQQKRFEEQQKVKEDSLIAESSKIPSTSLSPDVSHPPSLPQVDPTLPPPPPKRVDSVDQSLPNLTMTREQKFLYPSSHSSDGDCQSPILQEKSDMLTSLEDDYINPEVVVPTVKQHLLGENVEETLPLTSKVESRKNEGRPCSTMTTTMLEPSDSVSAKERPLPAEPFTVDSEDNDSDHSYELIDLGPVLVEDEDPSTFKTHYRFAPLLASKMPVGIRGDSAGKEKPTSPNSSDIKRHAERREEEELDPSIAQTSLSSPTVTQYSKRKQSLKTSHPRTRKPVRPAPNPPVSQKLAKDNLLKKRPVKLVSPSRLQGEKVNKAQQPQLSQCLPSSLHPSPITSPPPTYQVPKPSVMTHANSSGMEMKSMEENCLHEQPKEKEEPSRMKSPKIPGTTSSHCHSLPTRPLRYQPPSYSAPPPPKDPEPLHHSPAPVPPPPNQTKVPSSSPLPSLPSSVPDKPLDYVPMSSIIDDSYVNLGTVGSDDSWFSAVGSPRSNQRPSNPTKSNPSRYGITVYENLPVPGKPLEYIPVSSAVDDNYINWEIIGSADSQFSAGGSPLPIQPHPVPTEKKPHRFSLDHYVNVPDPDKALDYVPMSCTVDNSYVNWETISSIPAQVSDGDSTQLKQCPSVPTNSEPYRFPSDDYVNFPTAEDKPLVLLPRKLERQSQQTLGSMHENSPSPIPIPRMPQPIGETSSPDSSKRPTPLPRTRTPKNSVLELRSLMSPYTSCTPEELIGPTAATNSMQNPLPHLEHTSLTNHPEQIDVSSSLPPRSIARPVGHFHSMCQVERRLEESAFSYDDAVAAQEVKRMEITTGTPNQCNSSWQRSSKVLLEKQQDLEQ